jgi:hypothetical protein
MSGKDLSQALLTASLKERVAVFDKLSENLLKEGNQSA